MLAPLHHLQQGLEPFGETPRHPFDMILHIYNHSTQIINQ